MVTGVSLRRNIASSAVGNAVSLLLQLGLVTLLARLLSSELFGRYILAAATVAVCEIASDWGLRVWLAKHFATDWELGDGLVLTSLYKLLTSVFLACFLYFFHPTLLSLREVFLCLLISIVQPSSDPFIWYFRGKQRLDYEAFTVISWRVLVVVLVAAVGVGSHSLSLILWAWLSVNCLRVAAEAKIQARVDRSRSGVQPELTLGDCFALLPKIIVESMPIGFAFLLMAGNQRLPIFLLGQISTAAQVAIFGIPLSLVAAGSFIANSITISFLGELSKAHLGGATSDLARLIGGAIRLVNWIFVPLAVGGMVVGPPLVVFIYGKAFVWGGVILATLMPGYYASAINFSIRYTLNITGLAYFDILAVVMGAGVMLILVWLRNVIGVDLLLLMSCAWVGSEVTMLLVRSIAVRRFLSGEGYRWWIPIAVTAVLCFTSILVFPYSQSLARLAAR